MDTDGVVVPIVPVIEALYLLNVILDALCKNMKGLQIVLCGTGVGDSLVHVDLRNGGQPLWQGDLLLRRGIGNSRLPCYGRGFRLDELDLLRRKIFQHHFLQLIRLNRFGKIIMETGR